jgi:hypothetical protein
MKKSMVSLMAVLFLAAVSGPAFAAEPTPVQTPAAKSMKHKKVRHKKKMAKEKKAMKAESTPTAK